jgi:hypothetical protein
MEVKLSSDYGLWSELPEHVRWQALAQLALTGRAWCYVVCLLGSRLVTHRVEPDPDAIGAMLRAVEAFAREHLIPGIPPPDASPELVLRWTMAPGELVAVGSLSDAGDALSEAVRFRRAAERSEGVLRERYVEELVKAGSPTVVLGPGGWSSRLDDTGRMRVDVR